MPIMNYIAGQSTLLPLEGWFVFSTFWDTKSETRQKSETAQNIIKLSRTFV